MIIFKNGILSKKEKVIIKTIIDEIPDVYGDFYITKNNLRLYLRENINLFYECIKQGDKIIYSAEDGIAFITGFSDNSSRKYLKLLGRDIKATERLLKVLLWHIKCDLWIKLKQNNPLVEVLQSKRGTIYEENKLRFRIEGYRGKEILLAKKYIDYNNLNKKYQKGDNNVK